MNENIQIGMFKLAKLIQEDKFEEAEKVQTKLNVDYPGLCNPWMIAIRQLILAQKVDNKSWKRLESLKITSDSDGLGMKKVRYGQVWVYPNSQMLGSGMSGIEKVGFGWQM